MAWYAHAMSYAAIDRHREALPDFERSLADYALLHDPQERWYVVLDLTTSLNALGRTPEAILLLVETKRAFQRAQDTLGWSICLQSIAYSFELQNDLPQAIRYAEEGALLCKDRLPERELDLVYALGGLEVMNGRLEAAEAYNEQARELVRSGKAHDPRGAIELNDAELAIAQHDCDRAVRGAQHCIELADGLADAVRWRSFLQSVMAKAWLCGGHYDKAIASALEGLAIADRHHLPKKALDNLAPLAEAYERSGNTARALFYMKRKQWITDSLMNGQTSSAVAGALMRADFSDQRWNDSLAHVQQEHRSELVTQQRIATEKNRRNVSLLSGLAMLLVAGGLWYRLRFTRKAKAAIQVAHARSEALLLNILPHEVAEELKAKGHADAKHFDNATILFTDFKGFTEASEKLTPQELVEELNTCFKAFDQIITARGIEKIKTIGDAYMCAGGLPDPKTSSPADVVHAALEMQAFMTSRKTERDAQGKPAFEMRIGIHTGPVVAGIVGVKKFQYDIWGDTVNTASRMESSGEVGQVNISEATYALVREVNSERSLANGEQPIHHSPTPVHRPAFAFTPRGKVQAKGKGEMEMYFVEKAETQ